MIDAATSERVYIVLSPTVWQFVNSRADIAIIRGPRREGKTVGALAAIIDHAKFYPDAHPIKWAIVRDTWTNLQRTVMETLQDGHNRSWWEVEWSEGGTQAILNGGVARLYLIGMDRPSDANKFQGLEIGGLLIDEPAPAADLASGVPVEVLAMGLTSMSQPGVKPRILMPMNPPDEEHWTEHLREYLQTSGRAHLTVEVFNIPPGENPHLPPDYRAKMRAGLEAAGRLDLVARLVEGRVGALTIGTAVTPEFNEMIHVYREHGVPAALGLLPPRFETYRSWDFGLNPTVVFAQRDSMKRLRILGTRVGDNIGLEQFLQSDVLPFMRKYGMQQEAVSVRTAGYPRPAKSGYTYVDVGDPAGLQREQSNSDRSAVWSLQKMLGASFTAAPPDWPARRDSLRHALSTLIGGVPMLLLDGTENKLLIRALRGGWHYPQDSAGKVQDRPVKDMASHPGDALGYLCAVVAPYHDVVKRLVAPDRTPFSPREARPRTWLGR